MSANMYDVGVPVPIMDTYVPINFDALYKIGAAQKDEVEKAATQLTTALQKFGEFRSPSRIDTENWYKLTLNNPVIGGLIEEASQNPDVLKDAGWRSRFNAGIMGLDYNSLSMLKESADYERAGLQMRAKMEAEGRYNRNWDDVDITNYDTLGTKKVFDQITPIRYMTANELSNAYYDNLKPSSLGPVWKNGVKYDRTGITYDTLHDIANARFNDLVNTPQGQQYFKEAMAANNNDPEAAKQAFINMIADSQRDRIINQDTVNPLWLIQAKNNNDNPTIIRQNPTRLDFLNSSVEKTVLPQLNSAYSSFMQNPDNASKMNGLQQNLRQAINDANNAAKQYNLTGSNEDFVNAVTAKNNAQAIQDSIHSIITSYTLGQEFERVAGFPATESQDGKEFSTKTYHKGVKAALDKVSADFSLYKDEALLTKLNGKHTEVQDANGTKHDTYQFNNSDGFLLPETVFNMMTSGQYPTRTIKRGYAGLFRSSKFPIKELLETGSISDIQFIPDSKGLVKVAPGVFAIGGKARIPKNELNNIIGTGMITTNSGLEWNDILDIPFLIGGRGSTRTSLKDNLGASVVTENVGKNEVDYYEMDIYRLLPNYNISPDYWHAVNQTLQGGSEGGIGGATQAKEEYPTSAQQLLGDEEQTVELDQYLNSLYGK